ncbi:DASS family sodium-coupled anion symporter [Luteimonas sp. FCS-9]|uniref:DASS family sodium-coupled anion symporter n=1 Tax=Luteimonas sp. FCS-9 TaxID=1547516 RepID=UPI00063ECA72|nr:DASS family sodium-coupled anion symporter [Luteimonas sp. FCS-9]KLI98711.1 C4-dicarboxylate ABC transporter [Luteimonas sp. FCS-9]
MRAIRDTLAHFRDVVPFRIVPAAIATAVLLTLLLLPRPEGLTPEGWRLVAIFLTTIVAIILKVMPIGVMAMMAIVIVALSQVTADSSAGAMRDALGSLSSPLIWLIVVAILISRGVKKTGLGNRIGLLFIRLLGRRSIGIGYGLAACDLLLAPFTPSNTARGGGVVHPIMRSIASAFGSDPAKGTQGKVGTYLALVNMHANPITSGMFVTATAPNPLVVDYVARATGGDFQLSWTTWALCMLLPGLVCILAMPLVVHLLSPPELRATPDAPRFAHDELVAMGPLAPKEKVMLGTFAMLLLLWANVPAMLLGDAFLLDPTVVAFLGLFALIITGTIDWDDVLSEKSAWDTLIWFGALVMMAEQLNKLGVIGWFSGGMRDAIAGSGMGWQAAAAVLVLLFVFSHYLFASTTAHISAMMLAFLTVGVQLVPADYVVPFVLMMVAGSTAMMTLTHYATGTSPVIFGSGYVTLGTWWRVGLAMCVMQLAVYATVGLLWWKVLGLW